ncbi:replication restart helicase PriA [Peredibacter starrii]|uniref:Replication restart protein PriA n=1 Tax=Peredibacter starrii TaxID=28202 RepID=A0AAX4HQG9_9BACT|nr:primosomal protein N' [Peredibacter starrii]WPU65358.1 primosomal protein N' [Peredibacter starrii]
MKVARIAVNYPQKNVGLLYHYEGDLVRGQVVEVPLGKRSELGCVVSVDESKSKEYADTPVDKIKSIKDIVPDWKLGEAELQLYEWMSQYYHYSLGQLIFDCLPHVLKRPRELEQTLGEGQPLEFVPNPVQKSIIESIREGLGSFKRTLVHGVTGSGKTVVYLDLIKSTIEAGKSVLFLLPEINLTPQFIHTFAKYLDAPIFSYHSELSDSQKYQIWKEARAMKKGALILGVRSSIFIPVSNLGLIIIDEEHDTSFKQDDRCPYNARDVASKKAQLLNIPVVMGSATPSLETYNSFHQPKQNLFEMKERAGNAFLPEIRLIDARDKSDKSEDDIWPLVPKSIETIKEALEKKEQVLVFVNRLGFSSYIQCRGCGHQFNCPNCAITLRYYKRKHQLACHHCEYKEPMPSQCPACGCMTMSHKGFGTEKVEEVLKRIFPEKVIERFDRDEIKTFKQLEERLGDFHAGKIDLMVGTQMLSKGHNFEKVKLVLILGIDNQLNFPDFRSSERVYQTLTQVAGRAGRYSQDGRVLIQTLNPENSLFQIVKNHDFHQFYQDELKIRELCDCPPFKRLAMIHFSSRFQDKLIGHVTEHAGAMIKGLVAQHFPEVSVLGPRPANIEKKANQFTWSILLKSGDLAQLHNLLKSFEMNYKSMSSVSYKIDIDPYTLM